MEAGSVSGKEEKNQTHLGEILLDNRNIFSKALTTLIRTLRQMMRTNRLQ
jgi:hypothetical protein